MTCVECSETVDPFVDGELDGDAARDVAAHLNDCDHCSALVAESRALRAAVRVEMPLLTAPDPLRTRLGAAIRALETAPGVTPTGITPIEGRAGPRGWPGRPWQWLAAAAVLFAVGGGSWRLGVEDGRSTVGEEADAPIRDAIVASHLRSLQANHLMDVASSDRHTVKPWFNGKLDFSPAVLDLAAQGFPLLGGRLDYVDGRPVAALIYGHARHIINVFVWPTTSGQVSDESPATVHGYHVRHWVRDDMTSWAVSDVGEQDLDKFVSLLRTADAAPPAPIPATPPATSPAAPPARASASGKK